MNRTLAELDEIDVIKNELEHENRQEREKGRILELMNIRRICAAKAIQKAWRAHWTRKLLKKKKRKKKASSVKK